MSVRIYLRDEIRNADGFEMKTGGGGGSSVRPHFRDVVLFEPTNAGKLHLHLLFSDLDEKVPDFLVEFVDEILLIENFSESPSRDKGVYTQGKVRARLDANSSGYLLKMSGSYDDLSDILKLYHAIRAGTVQPTESWENPQLTRPVAETERHLKLARQDIEVLRTDLKESEEELEAMRHKHHMLVTSGEDFLKILDNLANESSFFLLRRRLRAETTEASTILARKKKEFEDRFGRWLQV
jgi:hypothetical protein